MAEAIERVDPNLVEVDGKHFKAWWKYNGQLIEVDEHNVETGEEMRTRLFGFETVSDRTRHEGVVPRGGAVFGYIVRGTATLWDEESPDEGFELPDRRWFALPDGVRLRLSDDTRVVVAQRAGFRGLRAWGGPIESAGRLRYIDRCSDTLLMCPPLLGDPCLNHLHFPPGIEQTEHSHPSTRAGVVARGFGWCETPAGLSELRPGVVFYIPSFGRHRFVTAGQTMDVIAYHPDSDWGPTDQNHPMINRTWIEGRKIDNSSGIHAEAKVIRG